MEVYICIIRGINVGGVIVKMEPLRKSFEALGFRNVKSYIQSGNLFFQTEKTDRTHLEAKIIETIKVDFGYSVSVQVLTIPELEKVIAENPYMGEDKHIHVTFLASAPIDYDNKLLEAKQGSDEQFTIKDFAFYLYCPSGYGKTNLHTNFIESKLKVKGTTRNWKTTKELLKIAKEL